MKVGFIGIGQMGRGMAGRLLQAGHEVVAWNRTQAAAEALRPKGATVARDVEQTLAADVVVTMLSDDTAVDAVWIASGLAEKLRPPAVHLNMASVSLRMAERLSALHAANSTHYVSAPVFGRPGAAASGELDIVAAGSREGLVRCVPLFEILGRRWFDLGRSATHANIVKIARNFMLSSIIESLGEAFALVQKSGVDAAQFLEIITSTSLSAPAYRNYGKLMIEPPAAPTFTLKLGMKDVELALQAGGDTGVPMLMAALIREQHVAAINRGYGDRDWAALGNYIAESAGISPADEAGLGTLTYV